MRQLENLEGFMCFLTEAHRPLTLNGLCTVWDLLKTVGAKKHAVCKNHSESMLDAIPVYC